MRDFASTTIGHDALEKEDKVLEHSIFFIQDSLMFVEFSDVFKQANVGRM